jgi:hypothetical protein
MRCRALVRPVVLGVVAMAALVAGARPADAAATDCLGSAPVALGDAAGIIGARIAVDAFCPCTTFDGSAGKNRRAYRRCAKNAIDAMIGLGTLRAECRGKVVRMSARSTCGFAESADATVCLTEQLATGVLGCSVVAPASECRNTPGVEATRRCRAATHCIDAADSDGDLRIAAPGDTGSCAPAATPTPSATPAPFATGPGGKRLAELINAYRVQNGRSAHPLSRTMMTVAGAHVADLTENPTIDSGSCVPHSWSRENGLLWSGCCYTVDHAQAGCMWDKPREISAGLDMIQYTGNGYEIALRGYEGNTPEQVLEAFVASPPHRAVILSTGGWEFLDTAPAMGAAMRGKYAVVWFGDARDAN